MIRLQSDSLHYLHEEVVTEFSNLILVSKEGDHVRLNPLILAAFKSYLVKYLNEDDEEHVIITDFTKYELQFVVEYCKTGLSDNIEQKDVLQAFGVLYDGRSYDYSPPVKVEIKEEAYDPNSDQIGTSPMSSIHKQLNFVRETQAEKRQLRSAS